jgi:formate hydrogenlyase subunit 3/multisubunit Na+/H+ antiporter MnhD subunit
VTTQALIEMMIPICIFGIIIVALLTAIAVSRIRLYSAERRKEEAKYGKLLRDEVEFVKAAHANIDAVNSVIYELSAQKVLAQLVSEETKTTLYDAHRKVQALNSVPEIAKRKK